MTSKELKELKKFSAQIRVDELEMFRQRGMRCIILTVSNTYIDAGGYAHE